MKNPAILTFLFAFAIMPNGFGATCTLSGNYTNTSSFQSAISSCGANDTVILTGTAQWSGTINVGTNRTLIVSNTATMNGNGNLISNNSIIISSGASFSMSSNSSVTVGGNTFNGPVTLTGPAGITAGGGPLPVVWIYFKAISELGENKLEWATASEINCKEFQIERSIDGIVFENIGSVEGSRNSNQRQIYSFVDKSPLVSNIMYYRLRQRDYDEGEQYSKVIVVQSNITDFKINVFPMPIKDFMSVQANSEMRYIVYNLKGQHVLQGEVGAVLDKIDLTSLANQKYIIRFETSDGQKKTIPFIKWSLN